MKGRFISYFTEAPDVSAGKKVLLVVLGILLFLSLIAFGPILALHQTVFNPDCMASYVDDIDVPALTNDWLNRDLAPKNPVLAKSLELVIINFEPQIKELMRSSIHNTYAFILDRLQKGKLLDTVAAERPLVDNLGSKIQAVLNLPGLSPLLQALGINADSIQKSIDVKQINGFFDMLEQLATLQDSVVFIMISFIPLIVLILALIIAIKLIARRPRFIAGELGLIFSICGALQFIFILPAGGLARSAVSQFNLPALIHDWLLRMAGDFTNIVMIYGGILLLLGIALIVVYYVLKRKEQSKHS